MIDLDLDDYTDTELVNAAYVAASTDGDDWTRAVLRAVLTGRGYQPGDDRIIELPIVEETTIKASGQEWAAAPGDRLIFAPNRTFLARAAVWQSDVIKSDEQRYTLSAWYIPDSVDAHGEWTDPATLQKAAWGYVRNGDRTVYLQHDTTIPAGEWVEIMSWPQPVTMTKADGQPAEYPAGTVFLGVVWTPEAWQLVKAGQLRGLSMGGHALRVQLALTDDDKETS